MFHFGFRTFQVRSPNSTDNSIHLPSWKFQLLLIQKLRLLIAFLMSHEASTKDYQLRLKFQPAIPLESFQVYVNSTTISFTWLLRPVAQPFRWVANTVHHRLCGTEPVSASFVSLSRISNALYLRVSPLCISCRKQIRLPIIRLFARNVMPIRNRVQ